VGIVVGRHHVGENQGYPIVPAVGFRKMQACLLDPHVPDPAGLQLLAENRIMIPQEQLQELLSVSPAHLIVVLDHVRGSGGEISGRMVRRRFHRSLLLNVGSAL
jgi:hypothetical protein